jgi:hypothetical protein
MLQYIRCKQCHGQTSVDEVFNEICADCWAEMEESNRSNQHKYDNFYDYYPQYEVTSNPPPSYHHNH